MKNILVLSLMLGTLAFVVPEAEARTAAAASAVDPQIIVTTPRQNRRWNRRWNNRGVRRVVVSTRITRMGGYRYRETIRTTYLPNGNVRVQVISRTRLGRWRNY